MYKKGVIIDGYVDEPASFGVPPYIGTYPRYISGILKKYGIEHDYYTIDQLRESIEIWKSLGKYDIMVIISGMTVPGKYVGGTPVTLDEIKKIGESFSAFKIIGGPIKFGYTNEGKSKAKPVDLRSFDIFSYGDIEAVTDKFLKTGEISLFEKRDERFLKEIAVLGADIIKKHPNYPFVMAEIESSRGCERDVFCSYCTEPFYGKADFRDEEDIVLEVEALYKAGGRYFRMGRQANIVAYKGREKPNITAFKNLYEGIRKVAPELKVLHSDNANAGYIAKFPNESFEILSTLAKHNSYGDIVAFGVESFDRDVIARNNLKSNPEDVIRAVRIVNEAGKLRENGVPKLLPGINLIYGLIGETNGTYETNYRYLKEILEEGLMLRRINIRKVMAFENTQLYDYYRDKEIKINEKLFKKYKEKVRTEIDFEMLKRVFPAGEAVLRDVIPEFVENGITFGRQLGTYPILVGTKQNLELGKPVDIVVTEHGFRSVTGVTMPFKINKEPMNIIESLPGIGKKRAKKLIEKRPFVDKEESSKFFKEEGIKDISNIFNYEV